MHDTPQPRLYTDLAELWPEISPASDYEEEAATFRRRLQQRGVPDGGTLLHLGCGGGSLDFNMKRHYRVTGVDRSTAMLAQAARVNPEVEYVPGDMRSCRLGRTFDAVLVHDAVSYMTTRAELAQVYRTAAAHLRPGGVLIALPEELRQRLADAEPIVTQRSVGGRTIWMIELAHDPDPADTSFEALYVFVIRDDAGTESIVDRHVAGVFELDDFMQAIESAGFDAVAEPWELTSWQPGEVPLPLITATRTGGG